MKRTKQALTLSLCLVLCLSLFSIPASAETFAGDGANDVPQNNSSSGSAANSSPYTGEPAIYASSIPESVIDAAANDGTRTVFDSGSCGALGGNLTWTLYSDGELVISGNGAMEDYIYAGSPWYRNRSAIQSVIVENGVTSISDHAFEDCGRLTGVTLPESVTSIGSFAFPGCSSLTGITLPGSVTSIGSFAFQGCNSLTGITLQAGLTSIGDYALSFCSSLACITIPESVTSIGNFAFRGCYCLTDITLPASLISLGDQAFHSCSSLNSISVDAGNQSYSSRDGILFNKSQTMLICCPNGKSGDYTVPAGVASIGSYSFHSCQALTSITLPASLTSIDNNAFHECSNLTSITVPESVTSIGHDAFQACTSLTDIRLPASLTNIGDFAFGNCRSLTGITLPSGLTEIPDFLFYDCSSLTSITIPANVTSIGESAFSFCSSLTSITIPANVTSIGESAFSYCSSLTGITLPASVTSIGDWAFHSCSNVNSISVDAGNQDYSSRDGVLFNKAQTELICCPNGKSGAYSAPTGVNSIGSNAFNSCQALTSITLPASLTSIGNSAFLDCNSLTSITLPEELFCIKENAFSCCSNLTDVYFGGRERQRNEREGVDWCTDGNDELFNAVWHYARETVFIDVNSFAELKAVVQAYDGSDTYVYYNGSDTFVISESITLPENLFFCADADGSSVQIPAGVTLTVSSTVTNAFYVENLVVEGTMRAGKNAVYYRSLTGTVDWIRMVICSGSCGAQGDNLTWTLYDDGELLIEGSGDMADYHSYMNPAPWYTPRVQEYVNANFITALTVKEGVTGIGTWALSGCTDLASVSLPHSLRQIRWGAFSGCRGLSDIVLPEGLESISSCSFSGTGIREITFPASLQSCQDYFSGDATFHNSPLVNIYVASDSPYFCSMNGVVFSKDQKTLVMFPNGRTGSYTVPLGVTAIGFKAFCGSLLESVTIPEGVTTIDRSSFMFSRSLLSMTIPASVCEIGDQAFFGCVKFEGIHVTSGNRTYCSVDGCLYSADRKTFFLCPAGNSGSFLIPEGVTEIGNYAFYLCKNITSLSIPETVTRFGEFAFGECYGLTSITIPSSVTNVGRCAFQFCSNCKEFYFAGDMPAIGDYAFSGVTATVFYPEGNPTYTAENMQNYDGTLSWVPYQTLPIPDCVLPASLTTIEQEALAGSAFRCVRIPDGVTRIGARAFAGSPNLEYVFIPESVTEIASNAFYQVTDLTIIGKADSEAEEFADLLGYAFIEG